MKSKFKDDGISFSVPVTPFRFPKILDPTKRTKSRRSEAEAQPGTGVESWVQQHVLHWKKLLNRDDIVKRLVDLVNEGNEEKVAREVKENEVAALVEKNKVAELVEEKEIADESREGKVLAVADEKVPAPVDKEVSPDSSRAAKKQRIE